MVNQETDQVPEIEPKKKTFLEKLKQTESPRALLRRLRREREEARTRPTVARRVFTGSGILSTSIDRKPLSPLQRNIIKRERVMRFLRDTPPMDRPKALRNTDNFKQQRDQIRSDLKLKQKSTSLIAFEDSPAQKAQARFRDKINNRNNQRKQNQEGGSIDKLRVLSSRLKAPPRLI